MFAVSAGYVCLTFFFGIFRVEGYSMYPNLKDGDLCITWRPEPFRADDVVFYETSSGKRCSGRVIGVSGDEICIGNGEVLVNSVTKEEELLYKTSGSMETVVEEGTFCILNDYRPDEEDSRSFGTVSREKILGKVIFILRRRGF